MNPLVRRIVVLALLVVPSLALAQEPQQVIYDNKIVYGVGGGVSVPVGDAEDGLERGFVVQAFARYRLSDSPFIPRVDFEYQKSDLNAVSGTSEIFAGTVNLQLFLGGAQSIRFYAMGGIGAYHVKFETDASLGSQGPVPATSESATRFGLNGGGGIAFRVTPTLSIYGEIRLENILNDEGAVNSDLQLVPFTFGVTF